MACKLIPLQCLDLVSYHIGKIGTRVQQCLTSRYRFLTAKLHMDSLTKQPHRKALRLTLENLPPELDETYNDALARIGSQDKEDTNIAHQVLGWVTHATRPLTIKQLQHALSVEPEQADLDEETLIDEELLISTCLGLVTVDHTSKQVRLVHYTAQEYFEHRLLELFPDNHLRIASTCLTYLSFKTCQEVDESTSNKEIKALKYRYALLDYAGSNWGFHAQRDDQKLVQQILHFLSPKATYLSSRLMVGGFKSLIKGSTPKHWDYPVKYEARVSGHNMAAYFGLQHTLMTLLSEASGIKDMIKSTILICAAKGYHTLVQLLLDRDANINTRSSLGYTPLYLATVKGNLAMTKVLLDRGADVNKRYSPYRHSLYQYLLYRQPPSTTVLELAAENGYAAILQAFLEYGANANTHCYDTDHASEHTPLRLAVLSKDVASVNVLLNGGADINALHLNSHLLFGPGKTKLYGFRTTVLLDAVSQQQEAIVNLLLNRGADVNIGDATPLCHAVSERNGRMVSLLIKNGADVRTPGTVEVLNHLLKKQYIYSSLPESSPEESLSEEFSYEKFLGRALAAIANTLEPGSVAETLIDSGADINFLSIDERLLDPRCLLPATHTTAEILMQHSTKPVESGEPLLDSPLHAASRSGNESLVRLLLDRGAKMWGVDKESWLQQAEFVKSKATEPVGGSYPTGDCSGDLIRASYRKLISSHDVGEIIAQGGIFGTMDHGSWSY